jgi:hypothetical protein
MRGIVVSKDVVAGVLLLAASIGYYIMSTDLPTSVLDTTIPSSALPQMLGLVGGALSLGLIVSGLFNANKSEVTKRKSVQSSSLVPEKKSVRSDWQAHLRALGFVGIALAATVSMTILGYVVTMALAMFAVARYQGAYYGQLRPIWKDMLVGAVGSAVLWVIFVGSLGVSMPIGLWRHVL